MERVSLLFLKVFLLFIFFVGNGKGDGMESYDVIVIGLGAAGTAASSTLAAAGKKVLAVEAQDRVGGRVMTAEFGDGVVELGAEWIHGTENSPVYEAATTHSVPLLAQDLTMKCFRSSGESCDQDVMNDLVVQAFLVAEDKPERVQRLGDYVMGKLTDYIENHYPTLIKDTDFMKHLFHFLNYFFDNYEATNDWNDATTASNYEQLEGHQHMSWHRNGYKTFFDILLNKYNNGTGLPNLTIKLNTEVTNINYEATDGVTVTCKDGGVYTAANVIVTVSLGVLKNRHQTLFTPSLPQPKIDVIQNMSIGVMDKIIFKFNKPWWPREFSFYGFIWKEEQRKKLLEGEDWLYRIFGASSPMGSGNALTLWTSGETAKLVETLPAEEVKSKCMKLLRLFMGKEIDIPEPVDMIRSLWHSNPFTLGSYSHDNIWAVKNPNARKILSAPIRRKQNGSQVFFAGEATHEMHYSTVHGAAMTGFNVAKILLGRSKL